MKKQWISAALILLLMLLIPVSANADVIYPAPDALVVDEPVDYLLATLDPGSTVWTDPGLMPAGMYLETAEREDGVDVYLRGTHTTPGDYDLLIRYNEAESICTIHIVPDETEEPTVVAVSVETLPDRTAYTAGDILDPQGLSLRLELSDGNTMLVTEGYELYPTRLEQAGTRSIEVNYQGLLCYFEVEVEPAPEVIEGIGVLALPVKVTYRVGDTLDPSGLMIRVYTNNGTRDVITDLFCEPTLLTQAGSQEITVTYQEKTCTFSVQVLGDETPAGLAVYRLPSKLDYAVGDTLNTEGLVLVETDSGGETSYLEEGFTCEPTLLETPGRQDITVRFGQLQCSFQVTVNLPEALPSAQPESPQILPAEPSPITIQPGTDPQPHRAGPDTQSGSFLVAVILVAALMALVILGVYGLVMNRSGREYYADSIRDLFRRK